MQEIQVIDSHTAGEPTRLVLAGGPPLGQGSLAERAARFTAEFDSWRSAIVNEPRGSDAMVGALLCPPHRPDCRLGVIFFNNVGMLGMCGHGTIGLVASLAHRGELQPGIVRIDTPVGPVDAELRADGSVWLDNVPSYRRAAGVTVQVAGVGAVAGDVAWGGNWFFLVREHTLRIELANLEALTDFARRVRLALNAQGHPDVDHVELFAKPAHGDAHSCNFVLCPGNAYDRSPCGTGTSAKLACLAADGALAEGEPWIQQGLVGGQFGARYRWLDRERGHIVPTIAGRAHVNASATLLLDPADPFCWGIR
jgi:4-hydroxyproline epimerase